MYGKTRSDSSHYTLAEQPLGYAQVHLSSRHCHCTMISPVRNTKQSRKGCRFLLTCNQIFAPTGPVHAQNLHASILLFNLHADKQGAMLLPSHLLGAVQSHALKRQQW